MAFTIMGILAILMILLNGLIIGTTIYRSGEFYKRKYNFGVAMFALIVEIWLGITSLPSNYHLNKLIYVGLFLSLVTSAFLYKKDFNKSRIILGITTLLTFVVFFFV